MHHTTVSKSTLLPAKSVCPLLLGLCASGLFCWSPLVQAQDDEIATDRPDFVESAQVVGKGRFQIETSIARETHRSNGIKTTLTSTPTLLRLGFDDNWEARIETDGRLWARAQGDGLTLRSNGWSDTSLGLKWQMQKGDDKTGKPGMAMLFHADLDSGSGEFRGKGVRPSVRFVAEYELANEMSLGLMPGIVFDKNEDGKRFTSGLFGIVLGKGWTEQWRTFIELSLQQIASSKNGGNVVTFDVGTAYLLNKHTQVDFVVSRGLNKNTPDWNLGAGFSIKF